MKNTLLAWIPLSLSIALPLSIAIAVGRLYIGCEHMALVDGALMTLYSSHLIFIVLKMCILPKCARHDFTLCALFYSIAYLAYSIAAPHVFACNKTILLFSSAFTTTLLVLVAWYIKELTWYWQNIYILLASGWFVWYAYSDFSLL